MHSFGFFYIFFVNFISRVTASSFNDKCPSILQSAGATPEYGNRVGHAIHSLSVRNLKKFKSDVTENNRIPTVNLNLTSDIPILFYAPDRTTSDSDKFKVDGSKILDEILSHVRDENYLLKGFNTVEFIAHQVHMEDIWAKALEDYKEFEATPPSEELCQCATDIENNGILIKLRYTALLIRQPELMFGYGEENENHKCFQGKTVLDEKFSGCPFFNPHGHTLPKINSAESWKAWKTETHASKGKDTGLFIFCTLNSHIFSKDDKNMKPNQVYHY